MNRHLAGVLVVLLGIVCFANAQQNCPLPPSLQPNSTADNIFSDSQEVDLGDAMAETIALHVKIIDNDELAGHLRKIGERLVQHLPPTQMKFRFYLIDLPQVNAFSIAGGRVYISRKIVAFAHDDNEVAGILAHELGHIVTHQSAIEMTRAFRETLGVTQVGNRDDIFRKYHQYLEAFTHGKRTSGRQLEKLQIVADQVSIYSLARAGYAVPSFVEFWDRFNQLHGQGGNWFTDLFGMTTPEQHRLREMIKDTAALPAGCVDQVPSQDKSPFQAWQQAVIEYADLQHSEITSGLILKRKLSQRLRPDITNLHFSPDGKYILAQDDGGINVLTHDPLAFLFYIPASEAREAHFTPDSASVVFITTGMRTEKWSIAERKRQSVHELTIRASCLQSKLSPDGAVLACLDNHFSLQLLDVATSSVVLQKKQFYEPTFFEAIFLVLSAAVQKDDPDSSDLLDSMDFIQMKFSPDGRYFVAAHGVPHMTMGLEELGISSELVTTSTLMYDLANRREHSIPNSIKEILPLTFAFLGPDKIVGTNALNPKKSHVLKFPSGEKIQELKLWEGISVRGVAHGDSLLIGPTPDYPLGILDVGVKNGWIGLKQRAADVYDDVFVIERLNGELALHKKDGSLISSFQLPESNLGKLVAGGASADLSYLAISSRSRGAVWNIDKDVRDFQMRRFDGVGFDGKLAYADFPKFEKAPRQVVQLRIDSGTSGGRELKEEMATQQGLYLIVASPHPHKKGDSSLSNSDVQIQDIRTGQALWSRYFPKDLPSINIDQATSTALLRWRVIQPGAQEELKKFPDVKGRASPDDYFCEVVDANLGGVSATFLVKAAVHVLRSSATREWAVVEGRGDQILTYALPSGEEKGHFFGQNPTLSSTGLMATDSATREVAVYDLRTSEMRQRYGFPAPVSFKAFSGDGTRLLVLTSDQAVYILDATSTPTPEPALASSTGN